jgi:hypothetical protein
MQERERCLKPSLQREQVLFIRHKHSQKFSPSTKLLATKSRRKNLFVVDENEHARERGAANRQQSNEDTTANISILPQPIYLLSFMNKVRKYIFLFNRNFECKTQRNTSQ